MLFLILFIFSLGDPTNKSVQGFLADINKIPSTSDLIDDDTTTSESVKENDLGSLDVTSSQQQVQHLGEDGEEDDDVDDEGEEGI